METNLYKAVEIKSLEQLKKNKNIKSLTELKKDGVVLAKLWFYGKTCYFLPFRMKGKEMVEKYIKTLNNKLIINRKKRKEREERRWEREKAGIVKYLHEKPGIHFVEDYAMFTSRSPLGGSSCSHFFSVRPSPGWDYIIHPSSINQYFAWVKAIIFDDFSVAYEIQGCKSTKDAILLGRMVRNYNDERWKSIREEVMMSILIRGWDCWKSEFEKPTIPAFDNKQFINADPNDRIWGIGYDWKTAMDHKDDWGENLLGKCYDKLRKILSDKETYRDEYDKYWDFWSANGTRIFDDMPLW